MKTFTVITVCRNAEDVMRETLESVLCQTCGDFEYLIQDGCSTDGTVDIARSYRAAFEEKGIPYRIVVERDDGIYDAMNRAVANAQGRWLSFMNAGDCFVDAGVLQKVADSGLLEQADVVYGDNIRKFYGLYHYRKAGSMEQMDIGLPFCHQSVFTKKELLVAKPYNTAYKIVADFDFYRRQYFEGKKFAYLPEPIAIYAVGGVSSDWERTYPEILRSLEEEPNPNPEAIEKVRGMTRQKLHEKQMHDRVWKYVPEILRRKRREQQRRKAGWKTKEEFFGTMQK